MQTATSWNRGGRQKYRSPSPFEPPRISNALASPSAVPSILADRGRIERLTQRVTTAFKAARGADPSAIHFSPRGLAEHDLRQQGSCVPAGLWRRLVESNDPPFRAPTSFQDACGSAHSNLQVTTHSGAVEDELAFANHEVLRQAANPDVVFADFTAADRTFHAAPFELGGHFLIALAVFAFCHVLLLLSLRTARS